MLNINSKKHGTTSINLITSLLCIMIHILKTKNSAFDKSTKAKSSWTIFVQI